MATSEFHDPDAPENQVQPQKMDLSDFKGIGLDTDDAGMHGPLSLLKGDWNGDAGFNAMTVPAIDGDDKFLANAFFHEVMSFQALNQLTPNRGAGKTQMVSALAYSTKVVARERVFLGANRHLQHAPEKELHFENGQFLNRMNLHGESELTRQFSVPHGDTVLVHGKARVLTPVNGKIEYPVTSARAVVRRQHFFDSPELEKMAPTTAPREPRLGFLPAGTVPAENMQKALEVEIGNNTVVAAIRIDFDTGTTIGEAGNVSNIGFIERKADTTRLRASFWILRLKPPVSKSPNADPRQRPDFAMLQYIQNIDINFNGVIWPHVLVNSLVRGTEGEPRIRWEDYPAAEHPNWFKAAIDAMSPEQLEVEFRKATSHEENNAELHKMHHNDSRLSHYILNRMKELGHS